MQQLYWLVLKEKRTWIPMGIHVCYGNDSVRYGWMAASINTLISQADETVQRQNMFTVFHNKHIILSFTWTSSNTLQLNMNITMTFVLGFFLIDHLKIFNTQTMYTRLDVLLLLGKKIAQTSNKNGKNNRSQILSKWSLTTIHQIQCICFLQNPSKLQMQTFNLYI